MTPTKAGKALVEKFGYGMLCLYAALLVLGALGVYGWTSTSAFSSIFDGGSDKIRAQLQTGRLLVATKDPGECRAYTFNNETSQMSAGSLTPCDSRPQRGGGGGGAVGGSFHIIRDSFNNR